MFMQGGLPTITTVWTIVSYSITDLNCTMPSLSPHKGFASIPGHRVKTNTK